MVVYVYLWLFSLLFLTIICTEIVFENKLLCEIWKSYLFNSKQKFKFVTKIKYFVSHILNGYIVCINFCEIERLKLPKNELNWKEEIFSSGTTQKTISLPITKCAQIIYFQKNTKERSDRCIACIKYSCQLVNNLSFLVKKSKECIFYRKFVRSHELCVACALSVWWRNFFFYFSLTN